MSRNHEASSSPHRGDRDRGDRGLWTNGAKPSWDGGYIGNASVTRRPGARADEPAFPHPERQDAVSLHQAHTAIYRID